MVRPGLCPGSSPENPSKGETMGIYDRQYYREEEPRGWRRSDRSHSMVFWIIVANVALYAANLFFAKNDALTNSLALSANLFHQPWNCWQLLTSGFVHAPLGSRTGILHIVMNMYILFVFGRDVEDRYGRYEFLWFYLSAIVLSGLGWVTVQNLGGQVVNRYVYGASGGVTAVVILFCLNFPRRTLLLMGLVAIPAWAVGVIYIGIDVLNAIGVTDSHNVAWEAHLTGALVALLYYRSGFRFDQFAPGRTSQMAGWMKRKPKLRVHDPEQQYRDLDEQADRILEKVHREGEASLTAKERRILEDYSRRMRQKRR